MGAGRSKVYHLLCAPFDHHGYSSLPAMVGEGNCAGWDDLKEPDQKKARRLLSYSMLKPMDGDVESSTLEHVMAPNSDHAQNEPDQHMEPQPAFPLQALGYADIAHEPEPEYTCHGLLDLTEWRASADDFADGIHWQVLHERYHSLNPPTQCFHAVTELRTDIAAYILDATSSSNDIAGCRAWKILLLLDRLLFHKKASSRGGKKNKSHSAARLVSERLRKVREGRWAEVWASSSDALVSVGQAAMKPKEERAKLDTEAVRGALQDEDVRAAMRIVDGKVAIAPESKASAALGAMFPPGVVPTFPPAAERKQHLQQDDVDRFLNILRKEFQFAQFKRGAGPGGSIAELWSFSAKATAEMWDPIGHALLQLALGNVPREALQAMMSSRIVALDRDEADKVRPLAIGNFLRKTTNKAKAKLFKGRVSSKVGDLAYCLGGGKTAELMHKTVLTDLDIHPKSVLHKFDVSNAHNEFDRSAALRVVSEDIPEMMPWVVSELCTATEHVYVGPSGRSLHFDKSSGGDQGDALVGILFPLLYSRPVRSALSAASATGSGARAYCYQDDLDMIHEPKDTAAISEAFNNGCAAFKLRSNRNKEAVTPGREMSLWSELPSGYRIETEPKVLKHGRTPLPVTPKSNSLPGSQLGEGAPEVAALCWERDKFFGRVRELTCAGLSSQDALDLVKVRTAADFVFLARTVGIPEPDARKFDERLLQHVLGHLGEHAKALAKWIFVPLADGGFGFASVAAVIASASAASWYENLPKVSKILGSESGPAGIIARSPWLSQITKRCDDEYRQATGELGITLGDHIKPPSQKTLARKVNTARVSSLLGTLSPEEQAVQRSASGKGAGAWLCAPCLPAHTLSDQQYLVAALRRVHAIIPGMQGLCQHRKPNGAICGMELDARGVHAASCSCGGWRVRKHNAAVRCLGEWAEELGADVLYEQHVPTANTNAEARLDLIIYHEKFKQRAIIDVTIVNTAVAEYISRGSSTTDGLAADVAESSKRRKYSEATIVPFAIEEHGRLGDDALRLIRTLAPAEADLRSRAIKDVYRRLGGVVQRLSADAVLTSMQRA